MNDLAYGLYNWNKNKENYRQYELSPDPRIGTILILILLELKLKIKERNYIHDLGSLGERIISFLTSKDNNIIKSFEFQAIPGV
jgi:hypothetical protein